MIKIFAEDADTKIISDWKQTNSISAPIHPVSEAAALGITTFPCIVECTDSSVTKTYAESVDEIMALLPEALAEISAG